MSFIGGAASVIVAILVSRKDNNNRRKDLYSKRAIIIYYMYDALCDLEDAMNMFVRDFEPFVKERKTYISDMLYSVHLSQILDALSMLDEFKVTDMPDHTVLLMFVDVKRNLKKIRDISGSLKEVHSSGCIFDDGYYSMCSPWLIGDYEEMVKSIDIVRKNMDRIKAYIKIT
ncbi:hypothetical protein ACM615_08000 [Rahnella sp. PAMC25617]|jgi:hypothetical protein|uniref:hypothetical protein n=1 Tax=Rahnella sp. PAMC25617 TaxID=3399684 RepID=UPI003D36CBC1